MASLSWMRYHMRPHKKNVQHVPNDHPMMNPIVYVIASQNGPSTQDYAHSDASTHVHVLELMNAAESIPVHVQMKMNPTQTTNALLPNHLQNLNSDSDSEIRTVSSTATPSPPSPDLSCTAPRRRIEIVEMALAVAKTPKMETSSLPVPSLALLETSAVCYCTSFSSLALSPPPRPERPCDSNRTTWKKRCTWQLWALRSARRRWRTDLFRLQCVFCGGR